MAVVKTSGAEGLVLLTSIIEGVILYNRSSRYTTKQNMGHALGLLTVTLGLTFVADVGGDKIAAGLAILILFTVAYKEKAPSAGSFDAVSGAKAAAAGQAAPANAAGRGGANVGSGTRTAGAGGTGGAF